MTQHVVIAGGGGFIGRHLTDFLIERGDRVTVLSRRPAGAQTRAQLQVASWGFEHHNALDGADAVVNLAGEQAVGVRLTTAAKQRIVSSRLDTTRQLVLAMAAASRRPKVFVCASAAGYYGPRAPDEALDETAEPGSDFLAELCQQWEQEAQRAAEHGVREVRTRTGIVLANDGGALPKMLTPFRAFVGGPIGSGQQIVPWIHIADAVRAIALSLDEPSVIGPVNLVAPEAASNRELSELLGAVIGRPSWLNAPAVALKALFGEGAQPLLTGQRLIPRALTNAGFEFRFPALRPALEQLLA